MNRRFLFEGKTTKAIVEYGEDKSVHKIEFYGDDIMGKGWFLDNLPRGTILLEGFIKEWHGRIKVTEMPPDLSFVRFWEVYGYKVGKKEKVIQLWQALSDEDRAKCLLKIPIYKQWLAQKPNMERLYPQTFLSQRRWENDFRL